MNDPITMLFLVGGVVVSTVLTAVMCTIAFAILRSRAADDEVRGAESRSDRILRKASAEAEALRSEAREFAEAELGRLRGRLEREIKEREAEVAREAVRLRRLGQALDDRQEKLDARQTAVGDREREAARRMEAGAAAQREVADLVDRARARIEEIAGLTAEEAKEQLVERMLAEARSEANRRIFEVEEDARKEAERRAKRILGMAVNRYAGEFASERLVSIVHLPSEEMKGRIIGREGRNIRALEQATGVDVIIDETPDVVVVSSFSGLRREIARIALERLIVDGRIHPARIEEVVAKVTEEVEESMREAAERATLEVGVHGLHPEVMKLLGLMKYRTSYTQNVLAHSCECAQIAGIMAGELGLDAGVAKRAALLHDLGKVIDGDQESSHALAGAEFARKYGESDVVVNAIASHHEEVPHETVYAMLCQAADALSAARPGARRESLEQYVRRLDSLERIARSFPGVQNAYAIQAGREVRVSVDAESVADAEAAALSREIARRIEKELTYPGQIKVVVIRETRAVGVAH